MFAQNVSKLMKAKQLATGENMRHFAERIGVPYGWLRRISTAGIQQESSRTRSNLKKLADELGFTDPRRMWEEVPERPDVDEIVAILRDWHLAVWCLLVAYLAKTEADPEQEVFPFVESAFEYKSCPLGTTPGLFADYLAESISSRLEVVKREVT